MSIYCIILAAGESVRFSKPKLFKKVLCKPVLTYSIEAFEQNKFIKDIIVVANKRNFAQVKKLVKNFKKVRNVILGGKTRQDSCRNALKTLSCVVGDNDIILIHNGANPLVTQEEINKVIKGAKKYKAAVCVHFIVDTVKQVKGHFVEKTIPRGGLALAQTPQAIKFGLFKKAVIKAEKDRFQGTDDVSLVERLGEKVFVVEASNNNFKITTPDDLERMKMILGDFHVGVGEDSHKFSNLGVLVLGGRKFKNYPKLLANSDGDVILHALYNAISSALGEGSLGQIADKMCESGIKDSRKYLEVVLDKMAKKGFEINNVSLSIEAERPKIDLIAAQLKKSLAEILNIKVDKIGITATTGEGMRDSGKGMRCVGYVSLRWKK